MLYSSVGIRRFRAEVTHIQVAKEVAVIQFTLWDRAGRKGRAHLCYSPACEMKPNSAEQSRSSFCFQKGPPCLIEIFTKGWEGRRETP